MKHPSLFLNTYSGAGTETRSGCRRLAGKRLHLPRDPTHRNGATEGGSQLSSGLWHHQQTAQHAEVSSWLAGKLPGHTGNHGETSGESLKRPDRGPQRKVKYSKARRYSEQEVWREQKSQCSMVQGANHSNHSALGLSFPSFPSSCIQH